MGTQLPVAVIGVGYLGRFHAQKYAALPQCELVGIYDSNSERAREVAAELGVEALDSLATLLSRTTAVSIAATTSAHHELGLACLGAGKHVLMEKPLAATIPQARELVRLAARQGVCLQVGYLERFNPALMACRPHITQPQFIEAIRISPFLGRGHDVDVVLDLMSHDLDLVRSLVTAPVKRIHAVGVSLMTQQTDLANVHLVFEDGCVANLTASRISAKAERRMRLFERNRYYSLDLSLPSARMYSADPTLPESERVEDKIFDVPKGDAILAEIEHFCEAIAAGSTPVVDGQAGLEAMLLAERVMADIARNVLP